MFWLLPIFLVRTCSPSCAHRLCHCVLTRSQISYTTADTLWPSADRLTATVVWCICWALRQPSSPPGKTSPVLLHTAYISREQHEIELINCNFLLAFQDEDQLDPTLIWRPSLYAEEVTCSHFKPYRPLLPRG